MGQLTHRVAATAAEAVMTGPSADLRSEAKHPEPFSVIILKHELTQPLPTGPRHLYRMRKLQEKYLVPIEIELAPKE